MPGQIVFLRCNVCETHYQFQFGGDLRHYEHIAEYYRLVGKVKKLNKLNPDERIEESFEFGLRQCKSCFNLVQTHRITLKDESGNVQESKTRTRCPQCKAETREINEFEEDITTLPCPSCGTCSLVEVMGHVLWD